MLIFGDNFNFPTTNILNGKICHGKKVEKLPKLRAGWGGGSVVWAMPKTTGIFLCLRGLLSGGKVTSKNISAFTP